MQEDERTDGSSARLNEMGERVMATLLELRSVPPHLLFLILHHDGARKRRAKMKVREMWVRRGWRVCEARTELMEKEQHIVAIA